MFYIIVKVIYVVFPLLLGVTILLWLYCILFISYHAAVNESD